MEDIAGRAGFTRGAFYSNFADKEAIFLALMDARLAGRVAAVTQIMKDSTPLALFSDLRTWSDGAKDDPMWLPLMAEFRAHALRSETARQQLGERERALRRLFGQAIQAQFEAAGVEPPAPLEELALIVQALDHGLLVQRALDPDDVPEGALFDALLLLFRAGVALSKPGGR